jgi:hypothetical protein
VGLPYQKSTRDKLTQYYFGRYVFRDRRLLGVRLAASERNRFMNYPGSGMMRWSRRRM